MAMASFDQISGAIGGPFGIAISGAIIFGSIGAITGLLHGLFYGYFIVRKMKREKILTKKENMLWAMFGTIFFFTLLLTIFGIVIAIIFGI